MRLTKTSTKTRCCIKIFRNKVTVTTVVDSKEEKVKTFYWRPRNPFESNEQVEIKLPPWWREKYTDLTLGIVILLLYLWILLCRFSSIWVGWIRKENIESIVSRCHTFTEGVSVCNIQRSESLVMGKVSEMIIYLFSSCIFEIQKKLIVNRGSELL